MNTLHVAKFGGTSMADLAAMSRCADIVLNNDNISVVVLSACSGITNKLVLLGSKDSSAEHRATLLAEIGQHHKTVMADISDNEHASQAIDSLLLALHSAVEHISQCYSLQLADEILSFGERLSSTLFTQLLCERGANAHWFDATEVMLTDSQFGRAQPDIEQIASRAQALIAPLTEHGIVVTQGFIGADSRGNITTLGRGGSDYSAALFAEALGAQAVEIWTDVKGIYTTDPRVVQNAYAIDEISFIEAAELSTFGAKVLHPSTLWPAIRRDIAVFVGSSKAPEQGGTWIRNVVDSAPNYRALAVRNQQTLVTVTSLNMLHRHGFLAQVFSILAKHKISVDLVTTSEVSVALTLDDVGSKQAELTESALAELREICEVKIEQQLALVALVGNNLEQQAGVSAQLFSLLAPYNLRLICHGASSHNLCFLVEQNEANDVVNTLHRALFEQGECHE